MHLHVMVTSLGYRNDEDSKSKMRIYGRRILEDVMKIEVNGRIIKNHMKEKDCNL